LARVAWGEGQTAIALLAEVDARAGARDTQYYPALLPAMVRAAISQGQVGLARRLVEGIETPYLYTQHARLASNAALAEATGDTVRAVALYIEAERRWREFGVVPEQGFALLGLGRCLVAEERIAEGVRVTREGQELFARLGVRFLPNETTNVPPYLPEPGDVGR